MADAMVIGILGGGTLLDKARQEYCRRRPRPYMKLVAAIIDRDMLGVPLCSALIHL